tara:strand:+ start:920 stop:1774 length:855 start_codon:yes stop_codon:yes gene_type:complete
MEEKVEKYQYDSERYKIQSKDENKPVIALWGAAIRDHLWLDTYNKLLETNKASFKMFLCGHSKPKFDLPDNLIFIHSECSPNACAEIAFRHALESNADHLMFWQDDFWISDRLLDAMIEEISTSDTEIVCGPAFRPTLPSQHCRAPLDENGYIKGQRECVTGLHSIGIVTPTMKRSTAVKMGGLDKRFAATQNVTEQLLRLAIIGNGDVTFTTCYGAEIAEDMDVQEQLPGRTGRRLSRQWHNHDDNVLRSIWTFSRHPAPFECSRNLPNQYYSEEELVFSRKS